MNRRPVTLQDIADRVGVSRATVSLALRNDPRLRESTRRKIKKSAEEMGYKPNPMVSALMTFHRASRSPPAQSVLAFLTSFAGRDLWRAWPIFNAYYEGAEERARRHGFRLEDFWLKEPGMTGARMSDVLFARNITGILIAPLPVDRGHLRMKWDCFASVCFGYTVVAPSLHRVEAHLFRSMALALHQTRRLGYHRVGLALPTYDNVRVEQEWVGGFLAGRDIFLRRDHVPLFVVPEARWNADRFARWYERRRPEVVFSIQAEVIDWLQGMGLRVPEDVGFVNLNCPQPNGSYSGIYQNGNSVGAAAVDMLVGLLQINELGLPHLPHTHLVEGSWVKGKTLLPRRGRA